MASYCMSLADFYALDPVLNFHETDMDMQQTYHFILPKKKTTQFVKTSGRSYNITNLASVAVPMTPCTFEWSHNGHYHAVPLHFALLLHKCLNLRYKNKYKFRFYPNHSQ